MSLLLAITWICVLIVVMGLFYYVWDDRNKRKLHEHRRVEISELAMIFQTLRDVVSEQKILAKEFNEQVEEKISLIRGIVNEAQNRMKKLQQEIYEQSQKLKELQNEIDGIVRQECVLKNILEKNVQNSAVSIIEAESVCEELVEKTGMEKKEMDCYIEIKKVEDEDMKQERESLYLKEEDKNLQEDSLEKAEGESISEEQENIRDAYRSLLLSPLDEDKQVKEKDKKILFKESGGHKEELTPLQKMVLEYHQAGMTTGEIARELGITKGEVRLILSLAISKSNQT